MSFFSSFLDGACFFHVFGSQRLNAKTGNSDIDVLCIPPPGITRDEIFILFHTYIREIDTKNIVLIPNAFVPVIKFIQGSRSYDVIFGCLLSHKVDYPYPKHSCSVSMYNFLKNCLYHANSEEDARAIRGAMVSEYILMFTKEYSGYSDFLIKVKRWAYRRGIYSNSLGYFNGVSLAVLVAHFFHYRKPIEPKLPDFAKMYLEWDLTIPICIHYHNNNDYHNYNHHTFQILTPIEPSLNCMYNTTLYQHQTIIRELTYCANGMFSSIFPSWFKGSDENYTMIQYISTSKEQHSKWKLYIESKLRGIFRLFLDQIHTGINIEFFINCFTQNITQNNKRTFFFFKSNVILDIHMFILKIQQEIEGLIFIDHLKYYQLPRFIHGI
jgi:poly(A) polymerase Pap1